MEERRKIWSLTARKFSGEISATEEKELEDLLSKYPEHIEALTRIEEWWEVGVDINQTEEAKNNLAEDSFRHIEETFFEEPTEEEKEASEREQPAQTGSSLAMFLKWAAIFIGVVVLGGGIFLFSQYERKASNTASHRLPVHQSEISTRYGSKSRVMLPDGTMVWLNSGSKLVYNNKSFGSDNRIVKLIGEGFFDVAKDADLPFIIHTGKVQVTVLGTSFDMKSYPEDKTIEATLVSGSIKVGFTDEMNKGVILQPHQKVTIFKEEGRISTKLKALKPIKKKKEDQYNLSSITYVPSDSTIVETSWVQNKLAFRSESFADLATKLERWYDVKINFGNSDIKHYRFTGVFKDENLEQVLKALQITAPFHYRIEKDKEVYITK